MGAVGKRLAEAENQVSGRRPGLKAEPEEASDPARANLFGAEAGQIARRNANHLIQITRKKHNVARTAQLTHEFKLEGNLLRPATQGWVRHSRTFSMA